MVKALVELGVDAHGVDISEYAIGESPVPDRVRIADIEQPLEGTYDLVTCFDVLEHLDHPEKAIENLHRLAKEWILINVWTGRPGLDVTHRTPAKPRKEWVKMLESDEWESVDIKPYMGKCWWLGNPDMMIILRRKQK